MDGLEDEDSKEGAIRRIVYTVHLTDMTVCGSPSPLGGWGGGAQWARMG